MAELGQENRKTIFSFGWVFSLDLSLGLVHFLVV